MIPFPEHRLSTYNISRRPRRLLDSFSHFAIRVSRFGYPAATSSLGNFNPRKCDIVQCGEARPHWRGLLTRPPYVPCSGSRSVKDAETVQTLKSRLGSCFYSPPTPPACSDCQVGSHICVLRSLFWHGERRDVQCYHRIALIHSFTIFKMQKMRFPPSHRAVYSLAPVLSSS